MGDGMIDIVIRHGGRMDFSGSVPKYVGGEENVVGFNTDYLSYRTLVACAKEDLGDHCGWRVYGSWNSKREAFVLKCLGDKHKCPRALENKQASAKWIAKTYLEKFRLNAKWDGLVQALDQYLPHAEHRKCARHVFANWKLKHGTAAAKEAFWKAVYASNEVEYDTHANKLKELQEEGKDKKAYDDFLRQEPKSFCRAFLSTDAKSDSVESNICESFNNAIVHFRDLQVIKMLEGIRSYIMLSAVPCTHAIAAISYMRYDINDYIHEWYSVQLARRAYTRGIPALPGREDWKEVDGNQ
ncbi:hypothetical protein LINPERHAP1_LOCUS35078, partial [Linum perenne]